MKFRFVSVSSRFHDQNMASTAMTCELYLPPELPVLQVVVHVLKNWERKWNYWDNLHFLLTGDLLANETDFPHRGESEERNDIKPISMTR